MCQPGVGGRFGGEWTHVYVWLSPFTVHLKLSQRCLLIGYIPIQNQKLKTKYLQYFLLKNISAAEPKESSLLTQGILFS